MCPFTQAWPSTNSATIWNLLIKFSKKFSFVSFTCKQESSFCSSFQEGNRVFSKMMEFMWNLSFKGCSSKGLRILKSLLCRETSPSSRRGRSWTICFSRSSNSSSSSLTCSSTSVSFLTGFRVEQLGPFRSVSINRNAFKPQFHACI